MFHGKRSGARRQDRPRRRGSWNVPRGTRVLPGAGDHAGSKAAICAQVFVPALVPLVPLVFRMSSGTVPAYMSAAEYAAHRGCSDSFIRRLRRQGKLVCDGSRIHVAESDRMLANITDPVRGGDRTGAPGAGGGRASAADEVQEAIRRERMARAQMAELELGEAAKELIRADRVRRAVFTLARNALNQLQGMRGRLRDRLAATSDPREIERLLEEEIVGIAGRMREAAKALGVDQVDDSNEGSAAPSTEEAEA
jgi:hypothetical protein